jgi:putative MATE family efflux protein
MRLMKDGVAMKNSDLTEGRISSHFKSIAVPASIGFLFNTLFNVVDSIYAGRLGTDALAGMAISFPIFFLVISLSSGLGNASTALAAISIGKKDSKSFHQLLYNSIFIALIVGIIVPLLSPLYLKPMFALAGAEGDVLAIGLDYTRMIIYGTIFFVLNFVINGLLYAQGNTKPFRNYLIIGFFANLILDPLFIFGWFGLPNLGATGIALATVLVQMFGTIYLGYHLYKSSLFKKEELKASSLSWETNKDILRQGIPSSLNNATIALGVFIINYFVVLYAGSDTVAAYGVSMRIEQLALIPTIGINVAVLTIVGQNFGAKNIDRIIETRRKGMLYGVIIMLIGTIVIVPLAPYLIRIFDTNEAVVRAGTIYLRIEAIAFTTYIFLNVNVSVLQGIKKPKFAVVIGVYRQILPLGIFILLGTTLKMGVYGVWWGIVLINWSAVFISVVYTNKELKKLKLTMNDDL